MQFESKKQNLNNWFDHLELQSLKQKNATFEFDAWMKANFLLFFPPQAIT